MRTIFSTVVLIVSLINFSGCSNRVADEGPPPADAPTSPPEPGENDIEES